MTAPLVRVGAKLGRNPIILRTEGVITKGGRLRMPAHAKKTCCRWADTEHSSPACVL